jgi:SNF2 family DNA or RNA helicase
MGMRVDAKKPFTLVYSLCKHEFLGYLIEPHVVQLNFDGSFSLTYQRIFSNTASDFSKQLDDKDLVLIKLLESIEQSQIIKGFYKKHIRPSVYFSTIFNEKLFDVIRPKIEETISEALSLMKGKPLFLMSKEGWPVDQALMLAESPCSILFHFRRNENETRYFPTIKYEGERIEFMFKEAQVIVNQPAFMLLGNTLHHFDQDVDGKKLIPFLDKRFISIPKSAEKNYFKLFVAPLIERHNVYAQGFEIKTQHYDAVPLIELSKYGEHDYKISIHFKYGSYVFKDLAEKTTTVRMDYAQESDKYTFYRIKRSLQWEKNRIKELEELGLKRGAGLFNHFESEQPASVEEQNNEYSLIDWLNRNEDLLKEKGYKILQKEGEKRFVFGRMKLDLEIKEQNDWFDVQAMVHFGEYTIPFIELRYHILNQIREFVLPSGEIALIPEQWFSQFNSLFLLSNKKNSISLKKYHLGILKEIQENEIAGLSMKRKMEKLSGFEGIQEVSIPKEFHGHLRPYQKAGYDWFQFLKKYGFGGCLADDMGLGKTVQTLALLQKEKEIKNPETSQTSLIIMPTSLIYNWLNEAEKFAPDLRILNHTGSNRSKSLEDFEQYDVVLSTYGTSRIDIDILNSFHFHYIILDESQNIKNASSKSFKAIRSLKGRHKLILSGTPIENSVADLWPQMEFINPGLLGGQASFTKNFVIPIDKKKDEEQSNRLQALVKPFILRRTKVQVASELPEKSEQIFYCTMTEKQADYYEKVKAEFRNTILQQTVNETLNKSGIQVFQGLSKLRQLANHPLMIDEEYKYDSGKFENVTHHLESVLSRGHKVLIFSSFVKQMKIYRDYFEEKGLKYSYLDGATKDRAKVVDEFRTNEEIQIFIISIKAGGVGLNLTEADYVFILDPWWNPAVEMQAVDRTHRIGQTRNVFIYKFITKDTVEEKILALQKRKKVISDSLIQVEADFTKSLNAKDIEELLS